MLTRKHISIFASIVTGLVVGCTAPSAHAQWTGCGIGAVAAMTAGIVGQPTGFGVDGPQAGGLFNCDYKAGAFVLGGEVSYLFAFGDLDKLGIQNELTFTGRLGVLLNSQNLLYAHAGWTQLDVKGLDKIDGYKLGIGDELRIPNSPLYLDLRYNYVTYDVDKYTSWDANAHQFMLIGKIKLGPGAFGGKGEVFDTSVPCDPKMANCKH